MRPTFMIATTILSTVSAGAALAGTGQTSYQQTSQSQPSQITKTKTTTTKTSQAPGMQQGQMQGPSMGEHRLGQSKQITEVFFHFDSAQLPATSAAQLKGLSNCMRRNPDLKIVLDGHADPVGPADYNVGLSARRAEAVQQKLVKDGVNPEQIVVAVYGANGPRRPTHAEDRRVTLWSTRQPVVAIVQHTFEERGDAVVLNGPEGPSRQIRPGQAQTALQEGAQGRQAQQPPQSVQAPPQSAQAQPQQRPQQSAQAQPQPMPQQPGM